MAETVLDNRSNFRFEALDGLRGYAALIVAIAHFCSVTGTLTQWPGLFNGVLAVDTFFVLSGFVLAHSFLSRQERGQPIAPIGLFVQRWVRLWVPFCVATLIAICLRFSLGPHTCSGQDGVVLAYCQRWNTEENIASLVRQLLLFYAPNLNAPSWTLSVELLNSLLVPALVLILARSPGYLGFIAGLSLMSLFLPVKLPECLYLFVAGCVLRHGIAFRQSERRQRALLFLLGLSYFLMLPKYDISQDIQQALLAPGSIVLVIAALRYHNISLFFSHPVSKLLGRLSFPMYLLHWPILLAFLPYIQAAILKVGIGSRFSLLGSAAVFLLFSYLLCIPFERFVDASAVKWGRQLRSAILF